MNHGDEFSAACHDGWDGGEEAQGEERVRGRGEVVGTQEGILEGGGEGEAGGVENVEGVGEEEEGDGEVDCCGVDWFAHGFFVLEDGEFSWLVDVVVVVRVWYGSVEEEEEGTK